MAYSSMLSLRPVVSVARTIPADDKKPASAGQQQPSKWWSPLFGFSSEANYILMSPESNNEGTTKSAESPTTATGNSDNTRFVPVRFTEQKARRLRRMTSEATSYHDPMYHSAIASRLASDFSDRTDDEYS